MDYNFRTQGEIKLCEIDKLLTGKLNCTIYYILYRKATEYI